MPRPLNLHSPCGEDFASLQAFDEHIISKPSDPPPGQCMSVEHMQSEGWKKDSKGRWRSPKTMAKAEEASKYFNAQ